jgi:hypothetical protein
VNVAATRNKSPSNALHLKQPPRQVAVFLPEEYSRHLIRLLLAIMMERKMRAQRRLMRAANTRIENMPPDANPLASSAAKPPKSQADQILQKRLRKKKVGMLPQRRLSPLEDLPTELLTEIFLLSAEISLPRATHFIGSRLSCRQTYVAFIRSCTRISWDRRAPPDLAACRFFTRDFIESLDPLTSASLDSLVNQTYLPLHQFQGPWDPDRVYLLDYLLDVCLPPWRLGWQTVADLNGWIGEAVAQRAINALWRLFRLAKLDRQVLMPQSTLRDAVIVQGCVPDVVTALLLHGLDTNSPVDYLDTPLWAWAEMSGTRGEWLMDVLKFVNLSQLGSTLSNELPVPHCLHSIPTNHDGDRRVGWWRVVAETLQNINRTFGIHVDWLDDIGRSGGRRTGFLPGE